LSSKPVISSKGGLRSPTSKSNLSSDNEVSECLSFSASILRYKCRVTMVKMFFIEARITVKTPQDFVNETTRC